MAPGWSRSCQLSRPASHTRRATTRRRGARRCGRTGPSARTTISTSSTSSSVQVFGLPNPPAGGMRASGPLPLTLHAPASTVGTFLVYINVMNDSTSPYWCKSGGALQATLNVGPTILSVGGRRRARGRHCAPGARHSLRHRELPGRSLWHGPRGGGQLRLRRRLTAHRVVHQDVREAARDAPRLRTEHAHRHFATEALE